MADHEVHPSEKISLTTPEGLVANINETGAFVESLTAPDGQELLFPRQVIDGKDRGGIPICAPVFGPGNTVNLPQHGFFRDLKWDTVSKVGSKAELILENPARQNPDLVDSSYAGISAFLEIEVATERDVHSIRMTMLIGNEGDSEVIVTPGFHPYFPVGEVPEEGLPVYYDNDIKKIDPSQLAEAQTLPRSELGEIGIANGPHRITMRNRNLLVPVLWTAHPDKYVCVEPTQAGAVTGPYATEIEDQSVLYPGQEKAYAMKIKWWPER